VDAHIGKRRLVERRLVDYGTGTTAERSSQGVGSTGPYLGLARCYHEHLHAARPAELMLMLPEILHCPRAYRSRGRRRHCRHQVSGMLPHHSLRSSASSRGRAKERPLVGNHGQRSLGRRIQIEVAVSQQGVQKELSQRGPLDT
jgi:hypothetical protein